MFTDAGEDETRAGGGQLRQLGLDQVAQRLAARGEDGAAQHDERGIEDGDQGGQAGRQTGGVGVQQRAVRFLAGAGRGALKQRRRHLRVRAVGDVLDAQLAGEAGIAWAPASSWKPPLLALVT